MLRNYQSHKLYGDKGLVSRTRHLGGTSTKKTRLTKRLNGTEDQSSHRETGGGALQFLWLPLIRVNPQTLSSLVFLFFLFWLKYLERGRLDASTSAVFGRGASTAAPQGSAAARVLWVDSQPLSASPPGVWSYSSSVCFHVNQNAH